MPTLAQLGDVLAACRIASPERWQRAARLGAGSLARTLEVLDAFTPEWWEPGEENGAEAPPGLTDYQRGVIELWFEGSEISIHRQLALNQFILLEKLGQGGQGEVYRARQINPARYVAIKTLSQDTETGRQRFEQEARAMMRVRHPAVARFYLYERVRDALGKPTDEYLIAMEYVQGTDLHRVLTRHGPIAWQFVARWAIDVLGGLDAIHANGFIHRDIKPANLMILGPIPEPGLSPRLSQAKILDFGAVKLTATDSGVGPRRVFIGTREYAPPEQWAEHVVPESDLYALGGTLFHALTGHPPYEIPDRDANEFRRVHTHSPIPKARLVNPAVPAAMSRLIRRLLAKAPEDRGTSKELAERFQALLPEEARDEPEAASAATSPLRPATARQSRTYDSDELEHAAGPTALREPSPNPLNTMLGLVEGLYLPAHQRPAVGHEPPLPERIIVLLRRPFVLLTLAILIGAVVLLLI